MFIIESPPTWKYALVFFSRDLHRRLALQHFNPHRRHRS
jgi:hypothetical protein